MLTRNVNCGILFLMRSTFGTWMQREREKQGLSQSALAKLSGINRAIVNKLENNLVQQPKPETLIAIAKGLKIPRSTIFREIGWLDEPNDGANLAEAGHILSMLPDDDLDEIIQIARLKLERQKATKKAPQQQTSRSKTRLEAH